jgi:uncharacterized protein (DUF302 family)
MGHWKSALVALLLAVAGTAQATTAATAGIVVVTVKGEYDDVKERVVQAIEGRGLVINYTGQIAAMLERTGKDLGRVATVYSKAEVVEFCSARLSRDSMEADPRNIVFCPYSIAVYTLPKESGKVYVAYRKPAAIGTGPSVKALRAIEKLLQDIVNDARK